MKNNMERQIKTRSISIRLIYLFGFVRKVIADMKATWLGDILHDAHRHIPLYD